MPAELRACQAAVRGSGLQAHLIDTDVLQSLYRRGLVYIDVPVTASDHVHIPPLEVCASCPCHEIHLQASSCS